MPTFTNIDGEESATVTFRVGSVQVARGTTNEEQEIICLGDPDSSNALAAVLGAAPASTAWGLVVRQLDSTVVVTGYSTTVNVSSLAGPVIVRSSAADAFVTVSPNSTAAPAASDTGVIVRQVGYSTTSNVSSVAGVVSVQQNSTVWAVQLSTGSVTTHPEKASTHSSSNSTQSSTSLTMHAANALRLGWTCFNAPTNGAFLYLKWGATASTSSFNVRVPPNGYYEMPMPIYTGLIDAVWDSTGTGRAAVTELLV